ncbi:MAG: hypothetical protein H7320_11070, partial [Ferruginibacter sp.]|nr:hypothetical protein [Ferruginibacter sp.]
MKQLFIFIVLFTITYNISAQHPWMIKDINATSSNTVPSPVGNNSSDPVNPNSVSDRSFLVNGVAVFSANDGINGDGLWRSDGTAAGTYLLQLFSNVNRSVFEMYETGGLLYYTVNNQDLGECTLWRTDGTVAGTFQILSNQKHAINPGLCQKYYRNFAAALGNYFYFMVTDTLPDVVVNGNSWPNIHDRVYKTDGTLGGTTVYYDPPGARYNGYQSYNNPVLSDIHQLNSSGDNLYIIEDVTTFKNFDSYGLFPELLLRSDGINQPVTILSPTVGSYNGIYNTADVNGNYLLINGTISGQAGLFRLYSNETTPVWIDTSNVVLSFATQTKGLFNPAIGSRFFYRAESGKLKVTDGTVAGTYNFEEPGTGDMFYLGGIANNKILVSNITNSFFWDGASPTSYVKLDSIVSAFDALHVFQANNKLFYLGNLTDKIAWTSELDGSNFLRVFYYYGIPRGALTPNGYITQLSTGDLNSFDAGYEPGIFKTNFKIFTGSVSNSWETTGNWSPAGIPGATDDVVIPALDANKLPVISSAAACNNITLCNSILSITGANLDIHGNVDNYLSKITGTGSVTLKSSIGAKISGMPNRYLFDVANVYINGTDVSFGSPNVAFNSPVTFQTNNKILASYGTQTVFDKPPFITGYNADRFLVTSGNLGYNNAGSATTIDSIFTMPIGNSINSYTPVSFVNNNKYGSVYLSVADYINKNGEDGNLVTSTVVGKCWTISSEDIYNQKVSFGWNAGNETPVFNHNSCHIAYNNNGLGDGPWVGGTNQAATVQNGIYTISQRYDGLLPYGRFIVLNDSFNLVLATSNITNTQPISGNTTYNDGMSIINTIVPNGNAPVSGNITATVTIAPTVLSFAGHPYVQRHYDIEPADNASTSTATVTLYYSQDEFTAYNIAAAIAGLPLLPVNATDAANYKNNLLIDQYHGVGTAPVNYT